MNKKIFTILISCVTSLSAMAQTWIWYPGDYEIWLGNQMNNRRTDRGAYFPPFWKQDSHYVTVEFSKTVQLISPEDITLAIDGDYNIKIDGKMMFGMPHQITIPAGSHKINIKVHNQLTPPTLFVKGETIKSDGSWRVTYEDKEWIDESGKASDTSTTIYMPAGFWNFNDISSRPADFHLQHIPINAVKSNNSLYDFGKETFGYAVLHGLKGNGVVNIYYGESREEAKDKDHCETFDKIQVKDGKITDLATNNSVNMTDTYTLGNSKAFRYIYIETNGCSLNDVSMEYEYMPEIEKGAFRCNDEEVNRMWDVGVYTLQLTTREFFIDGIKRDRWVWSGDAAQSYLMNYYLFNDNDEVKRTIFLLGGKAPVTSHINTIMDYTFYWFNSILDYYMYSGDKAFLNQIYPQMKTYMQYVLGRTDKDGMVEGLAGDWVFVDWADGPMDKHGQLSFEQILFCRSLESISTVANIIGDKESQLQYQSLAANLRSKIIPFFWNKEKQALVHNRLNGKQSDAVTRYANMFAMMYDYLDSNQKQEVKTSVIFNDHIMKITTPYMRFYELESLCQLGEQSRVMKEMKAYWGGMLREGATTFWEKYNPSEHGTQHLAMYGRPFGKSLCHAWGASPIYLLGKYYLGVTPTKPGYEEYEVKPVLGGLKWMEGDVPTPFGKIHVKMNDKYIRVKSDGGHGILIVKNKKIDIPSRKEVYFQYNPLFIDK
jgi:alpha-L-rhamnosidase